MPKPLFVLVWVLKGKVDLAAAGEKGASEMHTHAGLRVTETGKGLAQDTSPPGLHMGLQQLLHTSATCIKATRIGCVLIYTIMSLPQRNCQ
jgi:hypothetical protein